MPSPFLPAVNDNERLRNAQKTGASFRNTLPSSAATHLAILFAAATTADFVKRGETARYSSNGFVTCGVSRSAYILDYEPTHPGKTSLLIRLHVDEFERTGLARSCMYGIMESLIQHTETAGISKEPSCSAVTWMAYR